MWAEGAENCPRIGEALLAKNYQARMSLECEADDSGSVEAQPSESFRKVPSLLPPWKRRDIDICGGPP